MGTRVFISYCQADREHVWPIAADLKAHVSHVWLDANELPSEEWLEGPIRQGIEAADVVVSCMSPNYLNSEFCGRELVWAAELGKTILPACMPGFGERLSDWWPPATVGPHRMDGRQFADSSTGEQKMFVDFSDATKHARKVQELAMKLPGGARSNEVREDGVAAAAQKARAAAERAGLPCVRDGPHAVAGAQRGAPRRGRAESWS